MDTPLFPVVDSAIWQQKPVGFLLPNSHEASSHDLPLHLTWCFQASTSLFIVGTAVYQAYARYYRRRRQATANESPELRLDVSTALFLVAQGLLATSLAQSIYATLNARQEDAFSLVWIVVHVSALAFSLLASLACIVLLMLNSAKLSRLVFNAAMCLLTASLGLLGDWTAWTACSAAAYASCFIADGCLKNNPETATSSSIFGYLTFSFISSYISQGQGKPLTATELPPLRKAVKPEEVHELLVDANRDADVPTTLPGFWRFLILTSWQELALSFISESTNILCKFAQPWVLQAFLATRRPSLVFVLLLIAGADALAVSQTIYQLKTIGAKLKAGLASQVFERVSRRSSRAAADANRAELSAVNLVEIDVLRIQDFVLHIHAVWSTPLQVATSLVSLGMILGWQSGLAAAGSVLVMIPLYWLANWVMQILQLRAMKRRDARMSLTSEALANAHMLKLWAQEPLIEKKLDVLRQLELSVNQALVWVSATMTVLVKSASTVISVVAFIVALSTNARLGSEQIFPALMFCTLLILPLTILPMTLASWASCIVSYRRVRGFCSGSDQDEQPSQDQPEPLATLPLMEDEIRRCVVLDDVFVSWSNTTAEAFLQDVSFTVRDGELAALCGPSSGGKTTVLKMLIGSLKPSGGSIRVGGTIAYMSQEVWLMTGTIRDNILFGRDFDEAFYTRVIESCALDVDFEHMANGDATLIGSHGTGLSGGQKSRITLARAIYSRADIYLLDDPFAALDVGVHSYLVDNVFGPAGILSDRTRIVATNSKFLLGFADRVFEVSQGTVLETSADTTLAEIMGATDFSIDTITEDILAVKPEAKDDSSVHVVDLDVMKVAANEEVVELVDEAVLPGEAAILDSASPLVAHGLPNTYTGLIPSATYRRWFSIAGLWHWFAMALLTILSYCANVYARYMLKDVAQTFSQGEAMRGLELYAGASVIQIVMACMSMIAGWYLCLKPTCLRIHRLLVSGVLNSPMQFLHGVPTGEILNRFANDLARNDGPLFLTIFGILITLFMAASSLFVFIAAVPLSAIAVIPLVAFCWWLLRRVLGVLVDSKRLETGSRSPLITHLQETMDGTDIIKVFGRYPYFKQVNYENLETNLKAYMAMVAVDLWLVLRLSLVSIPLQGLAAGALLLSNADSGTLGLVMSYILQVSQSLSMMVLLRTQMEAEMVSVQRIFALADVKPEPRVLRQSRTGRPTPPVPAAWPRHGRIAIKNLSAGYSSSIDQQAALALRNINLAFSPGQSTAIVGRTGAGKSSLAMSLLRVLEPLGGGSIEIDGLDIAQVDVACLRSRVAIIPQNCRAFAGTVRDNLDPHGQCDESDLLRAVCDSMLAGYFASPQVALDHWITKGGSNLSAGQLQLLAIARCLLLNTNIIILDEVTAAINHSMERIIHQVLATQFHSKTRILISHRLENAIENDRIVVLDKGEVVQVGSPQELFAQEGLFRDMIVACGLEDRIS